MLFEKASAQQAAWKVLILKMLGIKMHLYDNFCVAYTDLHSNGKFKNL
jgi:hypothetical protein